MYASVQMPFLCCSTARHFKQLPKAPNCKRNTTISAASVSFSAQLKRLFLKLVRAAFGDLTVGATLGKSASFGANTAVTPPCEMWLAARRFWAADSWEFGVTEPRRTEREVLPRQSLRRTSDSPHVNKLTWSATQDDPDRARSLSTVADLTHLYTPVFTVLSLIVRSGESYTHSTLCPVVFRRGFEVPYNRPEQATAESNKRSCRVVFFFFFFQRVSH